MGVFPGFRAVAAATTDGGGRFFGRDLVFKRFEQLGVARGEALQFVRDAGLDV